jgi:hypothetical protein
MQHDIVQDTKYTSNLIIAETPLPRSGLGNIGPSENDVNPGLKKEKIKIRGMASR